MKKRILLHAFLIVALFLNLVILQILGLQGSQSISAYGTVVYPEHQLGVFHVKPGATLPGEASWVVTISPDYGKPNLLENPGFERGIQGWGLATPPGATPMRVDILDGWLGKSAVMVSDDMGYRGGLSQYFENVPPNTTFRYRAMIKTVDVEGLEAVVLYWDVTDEAGNWYEGSLQTIRGSKDWALYETSFTTPNVPTLVTLYPALVYNRGQVWLDEVYFGKEPPEVIEVPVILNWADLYLLKPFKSESDLNKVEERLKTVPTENFWGMFFICEEIYRTDIAFYDSVDTTWFGERLLGYPLYLTDSPGATEEDWKDEMYLRMIRGFYNYFHGRTKVGITVGYDRIMPWRIDEYYGAPAVAFIQQYYDFVFAYPYTTDLEYFLQHSKPYLSAVESLFPSQKKFWILTRPWPGWPPWEREAIALEMKNCLDRDIVVTTYYETEPPLEEVWTLMLKAIELYDSNAPYFETIVYGENLLTGYVGNTYGWVRS